MAMICHKKNRCAGCSCYRDDEGQMACWARTDGKPIRDIILETWELNQAEVIRHEGAKITEFNLWVSFIVCYGLDPDKIIEFAEIRGIEHVPDDCDPDDPEDHYGALVLTQQIIDELRGEV